MTIAGKTLLEKETDYKKGIQDERRQQHQREIALLVEKLAISARCFVGEAHEQNFFLTAKFHQFLGGVFAVEEMWHRYMEERRQDAYNENLAKQQRVAKGKADA